MKFTILKEKSFWKIQKSPLEKSKKLLVDLGVWLTTKSEWCDQFAVTVNVCAAKVCQQVTTVTDFFHQSTVSCVVFFVLFNVLVKMVDFPSKNSYLNFNWTCVTFVTCVLNNTKKTTLLTVDWWKKSVTVVTFWHTFVTCVLSDDFIFFLFWDCHIFSPL